MKFKKYKLSILALLVFPVITWAAIIDSGLKEAAEAADFPTGAKADIYEVVANWINGFLGVFAIFLVYMFVSAGFSWMISGGNAEKVLAAKTTIKNAAIGTAIALMSYIIVKAVMAALVNATGFVPS